MDVEEYYFTNDDVARGPPGLTSPSCIHFSANGQLTFLYPDETGRRQIYCFDDSSNESGMRKDDAGAGAGASIRKFMKSSPLSDTENISLQEQLRRERMRLFVQGISNYELNDTGGFASYLIPINGDLFVYSDRGGDGGGSMAKIYDSVTTGPAIDPHFSPDGSSVAFVIDKDLFLVGSSSTDSSEPPLRLTSAGLEDTSGTTSCALADFVAQEEMDRYRGFWWSPDSRMIAYTQTDESKVAEYRILHQGKEDPNHFETHRYPFAGATNPFVRLAVIRIDDRDGKSEREVVWMDLIDPSWEDPEYYLARVGWWPDGSLMAQVENREQTVLQLLRLNPATGERKVILEERTDVWINLHNMLHPLSLDWTDAHDLLHSSFSSSSAPETSESSSTSSSASAHADVKDRDFHFIWSSERSGFQQLYLYRYQSLQGIAEEVELTEDGETMPIGGFSADSRFVVTGISEVDERGQLNCGGFVYFTGTLDGDGGGLGFDPTQEHLYCSPIISTESQSPVRLTRDEGMHSVTVSSRAGRWVDIHNSRSSPPVAMLYTLPDPIIATSTVTGSVGSGHVPVQLLKDWESNVLLVSPLEDQDSSRQPSVRCKAMKSGLSAPLIERIAVPRDYKSLQSKPSTHCETTEKEEEKGQESTSESEEKRADGDRGTEEETLFCALYIPDSNIYGSGPFPTVISVYGGPHVQRVQDSWMLTADLRAQRLRQRGYLVIKCDNRGSSRRGLEFEGAIKWDMGHVEVLDQIEAVRTYVNRRLVDPSRVGVFGWSYGGYMSAMCLCLAPEVFLTAVAGAPVTSWDGYDTHYTERYMGLPAKNCEGYHSSSVMSHVENMKAGSSLMLVHGLIDENVHFRHTARLINKLIECRKRYDLVLFPCERHGPQKLQDRIYLEDRISEHFEEKLGQIEKLSSIVSSVTSSSLDLSPEKSANASAYRQLQASNPMPLTQASAEVIAASAPAAVQIPSHL